MSANHNGNPQSNWFRCKCGKVGLPTRRDAKQHAKRGSRGETVHLYQCSDSDIESWHSTSRSAAQQRYWRDHDHKDPR